MNSLVKDLEKLERFSDVVSKLVVEHECTKPEHRTKPFKQEYRDNLLALRKEYIKMAEHLAKVIGKI